MITYREIWLTTRLTVTVDTWAAAIDLALRAADTGCTVITAPAVANGECEVAIIALSPMHTHYGMSARQATSEEEAELLRILTPRGLSAIVASEWSGGTGAVAQVTALGAIHSMGERVAVTVTINPTAEGNEAHARLSYADGGSCTTGDRGLDSARLIEWLTDLAVE